MPSTGVQKITTGGKGVTAEIKSKDGKVTTEEFSHVIVAVGIVPNLEHIGLEELGIERDQRSHIKTDEYCRSNVPGIYAIGDCTEGPWLAHKAKHEEIGRAHRLNSSH